MSSTKSFALGLFVASAIGITASIATADPQPTMAAARDQVVAARATLANAVPDKGGHRDKALHLLDEAIAQVNQGVEYANKH